MTSKIQANCFDFVHRTQQQSETLYSKVFTIHTLNCCRFKATHLQLKFPTMHNISASYLDCAPGWPTCRDPNIFTRLVGFYNSPEITELINGPIGIGAGLLLPVLLFMFLPFFENKKQRKTRGAGKYEAEKEE